LKVWGFWFFLFDFTLEPAAVSDFITDAQGRLTQAPFDSVCGDKNMANMAYPGRPARWILASRCK
jgi:hypothetical protein